MARNTVFGADEAPVVVDGFSNLPLEKVMGIVTDSFTRCAARRRQAVN